MMLFGKGSRMKPEPAGLGLVVAGSKIGSGPPPGPEREKSPIRSSAVGTVEVLRPTPYWRVYSSATKKKVRLRPSKPSGPKIPFGSQTGPPTVPPNWLWRSLALPSPLALKKKLLASKASFLLFI